MADGVRVRPVTASDEAEWRRLWTAYLSFYETTRPREVFRATFDRILAGNSGGPDAAFEPRGLVALQDGRAVGLAHFLFQRSCWAIERLCYLQDLWTEPDVRGAGVGRALIGAVYAAADREGVPHVYWLTHETNATARRLYDQIGRRSGFIEYERPPPD